MSPATIVIAVLLFILFIFTSLIIIGLKKKVPAIPITIETTEVVPTVETPITETPAAAPLTPVARITGALKVNPWIKQIALPLAILILIIIAKYYSPTIAAWINP